MRILDKFYFIGLGIVFLGIFLLPFIWQVSPFSISVADRLQEPSMDHWFGTDHLGRDIFSRIVHGAGYTVGFSVLSILITALIGVPAGILAGVKGRGTDKLLMRIGDAFLAFPDFLLALLLSAVLGPGLFNVILAVIFVKWIQYSYLVRGITREIMQGQAVMISRINGSSLFSIVCYHVYPAIASHVLVLCTTDVGKVMLLIASLSYIGLGAQPPIPEWGAMLNESRAYLEGHPHLLFFPGLAIVLTSLLFYIAGDKCRDHLLKDERIEKEETEDRRYA
ncbi:ABC transporter permease [Alteribacillus bidgolensis]|uniref:Peptide/nickel transport system permease protein n=1 Tax=Alteribacillus bidgolensis TaxID=930129 RepID=A0A1G8FYS1_9BACI|nr:ABC transporter permease subunit [Alteribacillus bidgolensis]SDH87267.1 peptide/nickel transport system permease protein [Alteribacillus bidgolensis]